MVARIICICTFYSFWALAIIIGSVCADFGLYCASIGRKRTYRRRNIHGSRWKCPGILHKSHLHLELTGTGFGTIVGSAIFNILFVISMSAFFSRPRAEVERRKQILEKTGKVVRDPWPREPLPLTWWPLFRDSMSYVLGLCALAFFYFCNSEGRIPGGFCNVSDGCFVLWYESLILFLLYVAYCYLMVIQGPIKRFIEYFLPFIVPKKQRKNGGTSMVALQGETRAETTLERRLSFYERLSAARLEATDDEEGIKEIAQRKDILENEDGVVEVPAPQMRPSSFFGDPKRRKNIVYRILNGSLYVLVLPVLACNKLVYFTFDDLTKSRIQSRSDWLWFGHSQCRLSPLLFLRL